MEWNAEQLDFIGRPDEHGTLIGIPGGGKTRAIIGRILRMLDVGIVQRSGFIVLTFSRAARSDFERKGNEVRESVFGSNNVRTIHSLAGTVYNALRVPGDPTPSQQTVVARALDKLAGVGEVSQLQDISTIVVDEAQDISEVQYNFVCSLAERLGASVVLVGDPNQSIYGFQCGESKFLRHHPGWRVQLKVNYRSSPEIVRVVSAASPWPALTEMTSVSKNSARPQLKIAWNESDFEDVLLNIVRQSNLKSFAIIGPVKRSHSRLNTTGKIIKLGLQLVANILSDNYVPFVSHYDETSEGESSSRPVAHCFSPGRVHLLTVHGAKGLEFDEVVVINFHNNAFGTPPQLVTNVTEEDWRCLWYVALSRPRRRLTCIALFPRAVYSFSKTDDAARDTLESLMEVSGRLHVATASAPKSKPLVLAALPWTDVLRSRTIIPEKTLFAIEDLFAMDATDSDREQVDLPEWTSVSSLYGRWAETHFEYCYRRKLPTAFATIQHMVNCVVPVPTPQVSQVSKFFASRNIRNGLARIEDLEQYARQNPGSGMSDLAEAARTLFPDAVVVHLYIPSTCRWFDTEELYATLCDWELRSADLSLWDTWKMSFFLWQYECESRYRWLNDSPNSARVAAALESHADDIADRAASLEDGWTFQERVQFEGLPIVGYVDAINVSNRSILELKFTAGIERMHVMQALGYAHMRFPCTPCDVTVLNLFNGQRVSYGQYALTQERAEDLVHLLQRAILPPAECSDA